jgi:hypothetical protein
MRFWKTLVPDEPLISDSEVIPARYLKKMPPAVRGWCLVSIAASGVVVALATAVFRNAAPLLMGAISALFPLYMLFFWNDVASTADTAKQRAIERSPLPVRMNFGIQWIAISICAAAPVMLSVASVAIWFAQMKR